MSPHDAFISHGYLQLDHLLQYRKFGMQLARFPRMAGWGLKGESGRAGLFLHNHGATRRRSREEQP
jgi:hypothetical protein